MDKYIVRKRKNRSNNVIIADCNHPIGGWERIFMVETITDIRSAFTTPMVQKSVCFKCYRDKYKENSQFAKELEE